MRYDVAIIGAGADGLCAAALLARKGLKTVVVERESRLGGLAETIEFHPGFRASRWADELAVVPHDIFWFLDLARRGAILSPAADPVAFWPERNPVVPLSAEAVSLLGQARRKVGDGLAFVERQIGSPRRGASILHRTTAPPRWPGEEWASLSLATLAERAGIGAEQAALLSAWTLAGRSADPLQSGSALHLLAPASGNSGVCVGGWKMFVSALAKAAEDAGAEIRSGLEPAEIRLKGERVAALVLTDGSEIATTSAISAWDAKRTFLSLFSWSQFSGQVAAGVRSYRTRGTTARVLLALEAAPRAVVPELPGAPVCLAPDIERFGATDMACRAGRIADDLPTVLRLVSASDPGLAGPGGAVMTVTFGAVPEKLFDGAWTREKRDLLRERALRAAEVVFPGAAERVLAAEVIVPGDAEGALGVTAGDLWGGEIAPDQMFAARPWLGIAAPRTHVRGLYLAGPSSPAGVLATGAAGVLAARALMADLKSRR